MKKLIIFSIFVFLLIPIANASTLQELFSDDVTGMTIHITQENSTIDFYINPQNTSFDERQICYYEEGIKYCLFTKISELLNGNNFFTGIYGTTIAEKGKNYLQFNGLTLGFGAKIDKEINKRLNSSGCSFTLNDINLNNTILTEFSKRHPLDKTFKWTSILEKEKSTGKYKLWMSIGYGSVKEKQKEKIREIIEEGFYYFNIEKIIEKYAPNINISEFFDLSNFEFEITDIGGFKLEDGEYNITIYARYKNQTATKKIRLILDGIVNQIEEKTNETYVPSNPEVKEVVDKIEGLENNTRIEIRVSDRLYGIDPPKNTKTFKFLMIDVNKQTSAKLFFKLNKTKVKNPHKISLYVLEKEWEKLDTKLINSLTYYEYEADIPHFSIFLIAEEQEVTPPETPSKPTRSGGGGFIIPPEETPPAKKCVEGETICEGKNVQICKNNSWIFKEKCEFGCRDGKCIEPITPKKEEFSKKKEIIKIISGILILIVIFAIIVWRMEKDVQKEKSEEEDFENEHI